MLLLLLLLVCECSTGLLVCIEMVRNRDDEQEQANVHEHPNPVQFGMARSCFFCCCFIPFKVMLGETETAQSTLYLVSQWFSKWKRINFHKIPPSPAPPRLGISIYFFLVARVCVCLRTLCAHSHDQIHFCRPVLHCAISTVSVLWGSQAIPHIAVTANVLCESVWVLKFWNKMKWLPRKMRTPPFIWIVLRLCVCVQHRRQMNEKHCLQNDDAAGER